MKRIPTNNIIKSVIARLNMVILGISILSSYSCEDFVTVDPPTAEISMDNVFNKEETATAATLGMYSSMCGLSSFAASGGLRSVTTLAGFSADEFHSNSTSNAQFAENRLEPSNTYVLSVWSTAYNLIYTTNTVIEGVSASVELPNAVRQQLLGEAKFVRAFAYFYLVNLFGDVPLIVSTDYKINSMATRSSVDVVYEQIITDLLEAKDLMSIEYMGPENTPTQERFRPNSLTVSALLARAYLYRKEWVNAEAHASAVIQSEKYSLVGDLGQVFLANSTEAIWQLNHYGAATNSIEGIYYLSTSGSPNQVLSPELVDGFESGDNRRIHWVNSRMSGDNTIYYPFKYKVRSNTTKTEHSVFFRLSEQYLIRAEARAQQGKLIGAESAVSDLNTIRNRAGLDNTPYTAKEDILEAILAERRVELFTEWGHRWFDLIRYGKASEVLGALKTDWTSEDTLYPIPENELRNNPHLAPQNPGY